MLSYAKKRLLNICVSSFNLLNYIWFNFVNFSVADSSKTWIVDCHGGADFTSITDAG